MSRVQTKTDNSQFELKVALRMDFLPEKARIKVLDCFAGEQRIWSEIKHRMPDKNFEIIPIDKKKSIRKIYLQGDNRKFLPNFKLNAFDIIDLDAYGISFDILDYCLKHSTKPVIILTYIQSVFGCLPKRFLNVLGYTSTMIKKCQTLFYRNAFDKLKAYFALNTQISKICYYEKNRKFYIAIVRKNDASL